MKLIQTIFIMLLGFVIKANPQSTTLNQGLISTMENPNIQLNLYQVYKISSIKEQQLNTELKS